MARKIPPVPFTHYRTSSMGNIGSSSTKVREFSIAGQKLKLDNASDVSEFVKQLNKAKGLEIVNFSGNTLGLEACKALASALEGHLTLQVSVCI